VAAKKEEGVWDFVKVIIQALLIALVIRTFLFQPFNIPSGSLIPTLLIGDYLFVSKYSYGYARPSFAPLDFIPFEGRIWGAEPRRGDIVVFRNARDQNKDYIKRLIGLPGETVQMIQGRLYINGEMVEREAAGMVETDKPLGAVRQVPRYLEKLPGGTEHYVIETQGDRATLADNTAPYVVPAGHYFFMGDNRDDSQDSRFSNVGYVPYDALIGRAEIVFFSVDWGPGQAEMSRLDSIGSFFTAFFDGRVRWGRLFSVIR
jgi:signal peptidase I